MRKFYVLISLILSTLGSNVFAQDAPEAKSKGRRLSQDTLKKIGPAVKELVKSKAIPGAIVLVAQNNKVIYFKSFESTSYLCRNPDIFHNDDAMMEMVLYLHLVRVRMSAGASVASLGAVFMEKKNNCRYITFWQRVFKETWCEHIKSEFQCLASALVRRVENKRSELPDKHCSDEKSDGNAFGVQI